MIFYRNLIGTVPIAFRNSMRAIASISICTFRTIDNVRNDERERRTCAQARARARERVHVRVRDGVSFTNGKATADFLANFLHLWVSFTASPL